jgi:hypothetical protein
LAQTKRGIEVSANKVRAKPGAKPIAKGKLDQVGIQLICSKIMDGNSLTDIAAEVGVSFGTLQSWFDSNSEYSARAREARAATAKFWDDKATRTIELASDQFELSKAKELAHHYRWRAAKIAPREYGDKIAVGGADDLPPIGIEEIKRVVVRNTNG